MITVQAICYVHDPAAWHRFALDLGLRAAFPPEEAWSEFDGDGILAIHPIDRSEPERCDLHFLVEKLDAVAETLHQAGITIERTVLDGVGPLLIVRTAQGLALTIGEGARPTRSGLTLQPIWYQKDAAEAVHLLTALGLTLHIASDTGGWQDFRADGGGSVAFHSSDDPHIVLGADCPGDLDAIAARLGAAGRDAVIVDEAYNRTLQVATPSGDRLWINGPYEDMYGFHRAAPRED